MLSEDQISHTTKNDEEKNAVQMEWPQKYVSERARDHSGGHSTVCQGHDDRGYVDCGGVVIFVREPVVNFCCQQPMTAAIIELKPQRSTKVRKQTLNRNVPQKGLDLSSYSAKGTIC